MHNKSQKYGSVLEKNLKNKHRSQKTVVKIIPFRAARPVYIVCEVHPPGSVVVAICGRYYLWLSLYAVVTICSCHYLRLSLSAVDAQEFQNFVIFGQN